MSDVVVPVAARGDPSIGAIVVAWSSLPAAPRAVVEKSMLSKELWPLVANFASLAKCFTDKSWRVTSHFLSELDMARGLQKEAEASDARS